jgi:hypothetical protein
MMSRFKGGEGIETFVTMCDESVGGWGFRNIMTSQKSYYNHYDSVLSWLDFSYSS